MGLIILLLFIQFQSHFPIFRYLLNQCPTFMYQNLWQTTAKLECQNNRDLYSHSFGGWKCELVSLDWNEGCHLRCIHSGGWREECLSFTVSGGCWHTSACGHIPAICFHLHVAISSVHVSSPPSVSLLYGHFWRHLELTWVIQNKLSLSRALT